MFLRRISFGAHLPETNLMRFMGTLEMGELIRTDGASLTEDVPQQTSGQIRGMDWLD